MRDKSGEEEAKEEGARTPTSTPTPTTATASAVRGRRFSRHVLSRSFSETSSATYEAAILGEAHGLVTDMLADVNLPPHIISGLQALSNLLRPPEIHRPLHRARVSPLVSLAEAPCGSDCEESPFIGERPSDLAKRLQHSLHPSLLRRVSTSTWTTTTSATGMPTLEPEPCRLRCSNLKHSREDRTPGHSPSESRSNSPLPANPVPFSVTIPKSRSFSGPCLHASERRFLWRGLVNEEKTNGWDSLSSNGFTPDLLQPLPSGISRKSSAPDPSIQRLLLPTEDNTTEEQSIKDSKITKEDDGKKQTLMPTDEIDSSENVPGTTESRDKAVFTMADVENSPLLQISQLNEWDFPIFDFAQQEQMFVLSKMACKVFAEVNLMDTFRIPEVEFINYFHALELGYREKPYHNRVHATDVLHGVYYLTTRPIPGLMSINTTYSGLPYDSTEDYEKKEWERTLHHCASFQADDTYGIMGSNMTALELLALYTAAAMHDYDHPGRTNAFLVATQAPQAILYNDRAVLENHHTASAWSLLLHNQHNNFLTGLEPAEFKRFRFLVIEAILATDLKRHFEIMAEFNAKVNDEDAPGVDWTLETDRLLVMQMVIKLADINGPAKCPKLHHQWTSRIAEEFYEQGDEEASLGMPISPYMDRRHPQLAKLQETFINHLVAPLCNTMVTAGLLPGTWVEEPEMGHGDDEGSEREMKKEKGKHNLRVNCLLTRNLKNNHEYWTTQVKEEAAAIAHSAIMESDDEADTDITTSSILKVSTEEMTESISIKDDSESFSPCSVSKKDQDLEPAPFKDKDSTTTSSSSSPATSKKT